MICIVAATVNRRIRMRCKQFMTPADFIQAIAAATGPLVAMRNVNDYIPVSAGVSATLATSILSVKSAAETTALDTSAPSPISAIFRDISDIMRLSSACVCVYMFRSNLCCRQNRTIVASVDNLLVARHRPHRYTDFGCAVARTAFKKASAVSSSISHSFNCVEYTLFFRHSIEMTEAEFTCRACACVSKCA